MAQFLLDRGIALSIGAGGVSVAVAIWMAMSVARVDAGNERMREIALAIQEGAKAYLRRQTITIAVIAVFITLLLLYFKDTWTSVGFVAGAVCSMAAGYIGMRVAVVANVRTTQSARKGAKAALRVAFNGGAVTGLLVIGLALLAVGGFYLVARSAVDEATAVNALIGLALGSSLISVFARLGGGIYTKAADVGADLVGKIEQGLDEDDPRNPATIADNVGDNVGDCAGMAADVFETYAVSLIGAVILASITLASAPAAIVFPFVLGGISVIGALIGILFVHYAPLSPARVLMGSVLVSAIVSAVLFIPVTQMLFADIGVHLPGKDWTSIYGAALVGLAMTAVVVLITNYYTSTDYSPVRRIAESSETGHATNIITGLSVGMHATALPVGCIGLAILVAFHFAGLYGVAVAVMSMLSLAGIVISLDAFGPITDNAGGIAVMADLDKDVRRVTDELDAVGNTMKAVTKGYAIASAGLAALVLFGSYVEELRHFMSGDALHMLEFSLKEPKVIVGLFIGGLLPFMFTAHSLDAVGKSAQAVVREVRRQLAAHPGILKGTEKPEYGHCVDIVTAAALREMIFPALLPVIFVLGVAAIPQLGPVVLGGMLVGTIVTGLFVAIAMTTSGGAWDNAKKYIEEGHHGGKGSDAHAASVTGDTVGDPYKDTAGPAVNPMIKVVNIVAILIIPIFKDYWIGWMN